jgi:hypothetical protein
MISLIIDAYCLVYPLIKDASCLIYPLIKDASCLIYPLIKDASGLIYLEAIRLLTIIVRMGEARASDVVADTAKAMRAGGVLEHHFFFLRQANVDLLGSLAVRSR